MALIKDSTNGKFKNILDISKTNKTYQKTIDACLDEINNHCKKNGNCECFLTACFSENEIDFSIKDKAKTSGRIQFDKESGFSINKN